MKTEREAWFHEDDYRQLELLPSSWWDYCAVQVGLMDAVAKAEQAGVSWYDDFLRDQDAPLTALGIKLPDLEAAVGPFLPRFDRVTTGYSTYVEPCPNTTAFGRSATLTLFAGLDEAAPEIVEAIWLQLVPVGEEEQKIALSTLQALQPWNLILADWQPGRLIRLTDEQSLASYLKEPRG